MSANMPLERSIAAWMADAAASGLADGMVDDVLAVTSRQRPLPRPLALLRERPMRVRSRSRSALRRVGWALSRPWSSCSWPRLRWPSERWSIAPQR